MRVGSLFSGIGGLDLGLERAGMTVSWQSEIDPYCCRVLAKHWPDVPNLGDVTTIDWKKVPRVDLICGGYPCQPFSVVGDRQGEDDSRHLWPHFADALRELRPRYALLENVTGHLSLGFGRVLGDLAEIGYDAEWDCIPAVAVGAPHRRDRVFVVAYPHRDEHEGGSPALGWSTAPVVPVADSGSAGRRQDAGGAPGDEGAHEGRTPEHDHEPGGDGQGGGAGSVGNADGAPSDDPLAAAGGSRGTARESGWWAAEPDVGRVAHGVPAGVDRLRGLGNAVVPQVAQLVGERIMEQAA